MQKFFESLSSIQVNGRKLQARIFPDDVDPMHLRPKTVLSDRTGGTSPEVLLRHRHLYLRDNAPPPTTYVLLNGIPQENSAVARVTAFLQRKERDEELEFAYPWSEDAATVTKVNRNAIPLGATNWDAHVDNESPLEIASRNKGEFLEPD